MKNIQFLVFTLVMAIAITSCKPTTVKLPEGTTVIFHKRGGGAPAKVGEYMVFDIEIKVDSASVMNTRMQGKPEKFMVPDPKEDVANADNPLMTAIKMMGKGDSASIIMLVDSMKQKNPRLAGKKTMTYIIAVRDVMNEEQLIAKMEPQEKAQYLAGKGVQKAVTSLQKDTVYLASLPKRAKAVGDSLNTVTMGIKSGSLGAQIKTTATGLKYVILKEGNGPLCEAGSTLICNYYGSLVSNGKRFDDSYSRGKPFDPLIVGAGRVIKGWDEGLTLLKEGTTAVLYIPSALGYGDKVDPKGPIPPNADLAFYVELLRVVPAPPAPEQTAPTGTAPSAGSAAPPAHK
jgi:FKBP-type peptidyl-prolyl cis-trans isomerase